MDREIEQLAREAVAYREAGQSLIDAVALLVDQRPDLKETPFRVILVLRTAFGLSMRDLHSFAAWVQGVISRDVLEEWLQEPR